MSDSLSEAASAWIACNGHIVEALARGDLYAVPLDPTPAMLEAFTAGYCRPRPPRREHDSEEAAWREMVMAVTSDQQQPM